MGLKLFNFIQIPEGQKVVAYPSSDICLLDGGVSRDIPAAGSLDVVFRIDAGMNGAATETQTPVMILSMMSWILFPATAEIPVTLEILLGRGDLGDTIWSWKTFLLNASVVNVMEGLTVPGTLAVLRLHNSSAAVTQNVSGQIKIQAF